MTDSHRRAAILGSRRRGPYHTSFGQTCIPVCLLIREQRHLAGELYGQASLALRQAAPKIEPTQIRIKTEQNEEFWPLPCCSTTGCVSIGSVCPRRLTPRANSLNDRCITLLLPGLLGRGQWERVSKGLAGNNPCHVATFSIPPGSVRFLSFLSSSVINNNRPGCNQVFPNPTAVMG